MKIYHFTGMIAVFWILCGGPIAAEVVGFRAPYAVVAMVLVWSWFVGWVEDV